MWDLATNPDALDQSWRHRAIEQDIDLYNAVETPDVRTKVLDDARRWVEGAPRKDVWLRYDAAWVAIHREDYAAAVPVLEEVAKELRESLFVLDVWEQLASAYVHVERTADEIHAYDEVLSRAVVDRERLTPLLNQGEARMRSGDVETAIDQFEAVYNRSGLVVGATSGLAALAQWDLAVAYDRARDPRRKEAARKAVGLDTTCIYETREGRPGHRRTVVRSPCDAQGIDFIVWPGLFPVSDENTDVYFVPKYERSWYLAVGYEALALQATDVRWAAKLLALAEMARVIYLHEATVHGGDAFVELARTRLDEVRRVRRDVQARADKLPPLARDD